MTDIPFCKSIQGIQDATQRDVHLEKLKECIIEEWPLNKIETYQYIRTYITFRCELAMIDRVAMKYEKTIESQQIVCMIGQHE